MAKSTAVRVWGNIWGHFVWIDSLLSPSFKPFKLRFGCLPLLQSGAQQGAIFFVSLGGIGARRAPFDGW